jgi:hypothetical protein
MGAVAPPGTGMPGVQFGALPGVPGAAFGTQGTFAPGGMAVGGAGCAWAVPAHSALVTAAIIARFFMVWFSSLAGCRCSPSATFGLSKAPALSSAGSDANLKNCLALRPGAREM